MIISKVLYIKEKQNWSLIKLYKEKEKLEKYIYDYNNCKLQEQRKGRIVNTSTNVIVSAYEEYLIDLKRLITKKEKDKKIEIKYKEYTKYEKLIKLIEEKDYFCDSQILEIYNQDGKAKIKLIYGDIEYWFFFEGVLNFQIDLDINSTYFFEVNIKKEDEYLVMNFDDDMINITAKSIQIKTIDLEKTIVTYASIKYRENQGRTFYYISNIDNLKIGDYVWISVRDEEAPGIVENIEKFSYSNVPFPINKTKTIIRKSTKYEYIQFYDKKKYN